MALSFAGSQLLEVVEGLDGRFGAEVVRVECGQGFLDRRGDLWLPLTLGLPRGGASRDRRRKQRQLLDQGGAVGRLAVALLQQPSTSAARFVTGRRQAGELGDLDAVAAVGGAGP